MQQTGSTADITYNNQHSFPLEQKRTEAHSLVPGLGPAGDEMEQLRIMT